MTWADLEPIIITVPSAKAGVVVLRDGKARCNLSFSEAFFMELGSPPKVDVQAGKGDMAGKVRIVANKTGKFTVRQYDKGGARIQMPCGEGVPDGARDMEPCTVVSKAKGEAVIALPLKEWEKQLEPLPAPKAATPAHLAPKPIINGAKQPKVDVVDYLTKKGLTVKREHGGYRINGDLESKAGALMEVNRYRRASELEPVGMMDID